MIDREKVIKGLKYLHDCEAWQEGVPPLFNRAEDRRKITQAAIELLKEQEPVKPRYTPKSIYSWECGVCTEPFDRIANYCPNCGRAVKWE